MILRTPIIALDMVTMVLPVVIMTQVTLAAPVNRRLARCKRTEDGRQVDEEDLAVQLAATLVSAVQAEEIPASAEAVAQDSQAPCAQGNAPVMFIPGRALLFLCTSYRS